MRSGSRRCRSCRLAAAGFCPRLQIGHGVEVIALTSVAANLTAILGGILVFYEQIGSGALEITARFQASTP